MAHSSDDRNPVERLAEEFLERHRRGEHPPLTDYVNRFPEWAEEIRELFPALVMMERLKPAEGDITGSFLCDGRAQHGRIPERLGDFRILREVGRGGMGIVFEAEQESLGRHVALKVLPSHALLNPNHLQRFLREARSAAKLHHTNIVPVFGVGEGEGLHYYVMQFIAGTGLHEVINELRRLKATNGSDEHELDIPPVPGSLLAVTRGLLTAQFAASPSQQTETTNGSNASRVADTPMPVARDLQAGSAILSRSGRNFPKEVARVGLQVAEALHYAHGQGVLHRDIKPSNLLLDVQGTVWVTDFGLAKAMVDSDNLTNEGDVLGTLRYMAPERFRGQSDARSDVYALGLTLYELLTLRPAFDQEDRDRLIHQVTTEVPGRPRVINPEIPRDLETIVLKAIEHEPARRYQDADDLARDLERFLADRPIMARPVGALERAWKWALRKPAIASLLTALTVALVVGFAGITGQWREAVAARDNARQNEAKARTNFLHALETVNTFCTQVSQEQLLDQPGMQPLRRRLLELAQQYYQRFQREQGNDPGVTGEGPQRSDPKLANELAATFMRSGDIADELGDAAGAFQAHLRAKDILEGLSRADSKNPILLVQLARCYIQLDEVDRLGMDWIRGWFADSSYNLKLPFTSPASRLLEQLLAADPENPEYLSLLGRDHFQNSVILSRGGQYSESESTLRTAIATLGRARDEAESGRWLALAHMHLGLVFEMTGRHRECAQAIGRALVIFESLENQYPKRLRHQVDRADCLIELGGALMDLGHYQESAIRLRAADERLGELAWENPDVADVRYRSALAKHRLGLLALAQRRAAGAPLRAAIAIHDRVPAKALTERDLLALAWSYVRLGQAEIEAGRGESIPPLRDSIHNTLEVFRGKLLIGSPPVREAQEFVQIESLADLLLAAARAKTLAERIGAQQQKVRTLQGWAEQQPDNPAHRFEAAWSLVQLAELKTQNGELAEACSSLNHALPVLQELAKAEPENLRWRQGLARAWEALGRVLARSRNKAEARNAAARAVEIVEELTRRDSAYVYDLACMLNLRGTLSSSKADATASTAALRQAIKDGFDNAHLLKTDPRLDGLRSRPDFPVLPE
jgi:serine/threonine protein kinase/tetratricopeptide (TPR) repeat protein